MLRADADLAGVGHRVVHGGEAFQAPTRITTQVVARIRSLIPLAPLHNPANLTGIEVAMRRFPRIPHVAVFDTAFHQSMPPEAYRYALPEAWYRDHQVRRYGFHGTSHAWVTRRAAELLGRPLDQLNLITLHLGNGASAAAIGGGRSLDTSMGLTPLEGLMMGTRSGDIDPAIPNFVGNTLGLSNEAVDRALNRDSGLKGICGVNDMREVLARAGSGDPNARLARDMYCYRAKKYIGAYCAVLGRVDALVFTAGIGEHSPDIRAGICAGLEGMGIRLDEERNGQRLEDARAIHRDDSRVAVLVIPTDEELEIARQTRAVIEAG